MEDPSKVVLTKEQAELLLPLLPTLQQQSNSLINGSKFTVTDMFERRKGRATQAQNYLLTIVREACKAANLWDSAPHLKDISPSSRKKFFDTVFTLCPQLTSCRHMVTTRLSMTLVNRRNFLKRTGKFEPTPEPNLYQPIINGHQSHETSPSIEDSHESRAPSVESPHTTNTANIMSISREKESAEQISPGDKVKIVNNGLELGRAMFLKMNTDEVYEEFAKVLITSVKPESVIGSVELPQASDSGTYEFAQLQKGDIILWKRTKLEKIIDSGKRKEPTRNDDNSDGPSSPQRPNKRNSGCRSSGDGVQSRKAKDNGIGARRSKIQKAKQPSNSHHLSDYEKERQARIDENERVLSSLSIQPRSLEKSKDTPNVGEIVALTCDLYEDRPLIGQILEMSTKDNTIKVGWYTGTYNGQWKIWKGKQNGKTSQFTDILDKDAVIFRNIVFTEAKRLPPSVITALKAVYEK